MSGQIPLHRQLADELRRAIVAGEYVPGSALPSENELAQRFGVARGTVRHALTVLRAEGAVGSRRGAGWIVLAAPLVQSFSELLSFSAWAASVGKEPGGRVVELARKAARPDDAAHLGVAVGAPVFSLVRLRLLSGFPVMVERTTFVESVGRLVMALDLERDSIYEQLGDRGIVFERARHTIDAIPAGAEDARFLDVPRRTPLLRERRASTSAAGTPLEWSDDRYRGDVVAFVIDNTATSGNLERLLSGAEPSEVDSGAGDLG